MYVCHSNEIGSRFMITHALQHHIVNMLKIPQKTKQARQIQDSCCALWVKYLLDIQYTIRLYCKCFIAVKMVTVFLYFYSLTNMTHLQTFYYIFLQIYILHQNSIMLKLNYSLNDTNSFVHI